MTAPLTPAEIAWLDDESTDAECRELNDAARQPLRVRPKMRSAAGRATLERARVLLRQRAVVTLGEVVAVELFGDASAPAPAAAPFADARPTHYARRLTR